MLAPQLVASALLLASAVMGAPAPLDAKAYMLQARQNAAAVSTLSASAKADVAVFANLARLSYCSSGSINSGAAGGGTITPIASGGKDQLIPGWYVAYSTSLKAIIVAHQGTNAQSLLSILEDVKFIPTALPEDRFPGAGAAGVKVHSGFQITQGFTSAQVLAAVKKGTAQFKTNKVITIGHSLGGAIAELDAIYLKLQIPSLSVSTRTFGLPRTGNDAFASFAVRVVPDSTHVTNKRDPVPRLPGRALGFTQIEGEIFIQTDDVYRSCPGLENTNCAVGNAILKSNVFDHAGPYNGIMMGPDACPL